MASRILTMFNTKHFRKLCYQCHSKRALSVSTGMLVLEWSMNFCIGFTLNLLFLFHSVFAFVVLYSWGIGSNGQLGHAKFNTVLTFYYFSIFRHVQ